MVEVFGTGHTTVIKTSGGGHFQTFDTVANVMAEINRLRVEAEEALCPPRPGPELLAQLRKQIEGRRRTARNMVTGKYGYADGRLESYEEVLGLIGAIEKF